MGLLGEEVMGLKGLKFEVHVIPNEREESVGINVKES